MQSPTPQSFSWLRPHLVCLRLQLLLTCTVLLTLLMLPGKSLACSCNIRNCPDFDASDCMHGVVKDYCNCCDQCARGVGENCGDFFPNCAEGLACVFTEDDDYSGPEDEQKPGTCEALESTTLPQKTTTSTTVASPTLPITVETVTKSTTGDVSLTTTQVPSELECAPQCSPDYCNGGNNKRGRKCSARGLEYIRNPSRNACQQTICGACFLLKKLPCDQWQCGEPLSKQCMRRFRECVKEHFVESPQENFMMELVDNQTISMASQGRVICHIPNL